MSTTEPRAPFSDLAHCLADATAGVALAHLRDGSLTLPPEGPAWEAAVDEVDALLTQLCGGCSGRASMVLTEAMEEFEAVYRYASDAKYPLPVLCNIDFARALLLLTLRRHFTRNPASRTHH